MGERTVNLTALRAVLDYVQHHRDGDGTTGRKHCAWWGGEPCTCGLASLEARLNRALADAAPRA